MHITIKDDASGSLVLTTLHDKVQVSLRYNGHEVVICLDETENRDLRKVLKFLSQ